jgi:NAD(P)-dependent dehydrogenase (short-subunit alcohol dehydrogenase family)
MMPAVSASERANQEIHRMAKASRSAQARVIVITGVTKGLGRALAEGLARAGQQVVGCGRTAGAIQRMRSLLGHPHDFAELDVTHDPAVKAWADRVIAEHGPPDLLINNAAVINHNAPLWEIPAVEFDHVIDVNIKGVVNVIRHFAPAMIARGSGVIANLSSGWGRSTSPEVAPYCASKWAIEGLTRALAQELPHGLAAVPVNPGIIDTDMLKSCFGESASEYLGPEEWAKSAVPFFLGLGPSDNGKPMTVSGA